MDNTNVQHWEMSCYFKLASKNGFRVVVVESKTPWREDPEELAKRNKHSVTVDVLRRKIGRQDVWPDKYFT